MHRSGIYPPWLVHLGVELIIARHMSVAAMGHFAKQRIQVILGALCATPRDVVASFLNPTPLKMTG